MLIRRLVEYAGTAGGKTPRGYRERAVRWAIVINANGSSALVSLAGPPKEPAKMYAAPYLTRTSGVAAMLLVDTLEYVFGVAKDDSDRASAGAERRNDAYLELLREWWQSTDAKIAQVVGDFFAEERHLNLLTELADGAKSSDLVAVMVDGAWAHEDDSAIRFWGQVSRERKSSGDEGLCLACGEYGALLKTVPDMIKSSLIPVGVDSAGRPKRGRDAALVSVNTTAQGRSGTLQLANTPLCEDCGGQAMAALNTLLADKRHHRRGDDSVLTWWLQNPATTFDPLILDQPKLADVRRLLSEVHAGGPGTKKLKEDGFHALNLSANQSRVVVRDWIDVPLFDIKEHFAAWFDDHGCVDLWQAGVHYVPLWQM